MAIMYNMGGACGGAGTIMNIKLHNTGRLDRGYKLNYFQKESLENVLLFWGKRKSGRSAPNSADKNFGRYRFSPMTTAKSALCMERRSTANVFLQFMNFYQKRGCHGRSG